MRLVLYLIALLLVSCATPTIKVITEKNESREVSRGERPTIFEIPSDVVGPEYKGEITSDAKKGEPVIALILGPSYLNSLLLPCFFRSTEEKKINFNMIVAHEWSLPYAILYAKGTAFGRQEWFALDVERRLKEKKRSYKENYNNALIPILEKEFQGDLIENYPKVLFIPVVNKELRKITYEKRGNTLDALKNAMSGPAFLEEVFADQYLRKLGADIVIGVDVLPKELNIKRDGDLLVGLYTRSKQNIEHEQKRLDLFYSLDTSSNPFDEMAKIDRINCRESKEIANQIADYLENWKRPEIRVESIE